MKFALRGMILWGIISQLPLASLADAQDPSALTGRKLAVVVGINAFRANSNLPQLSHSAADARKLSAVLRQAGFTVFEMTHEAAGQPGKEFLAPNLVYIRDQIDGVLGYPNLGDDDAVLISLHGHGVQFDETDETGNRTARFYFCPADATVAGVQTANELKEVNHLLPLAELYASLGKCSAATKLLIVDACRNDPTRPDIFRSTLASSTLPKLPPPPGGMAAFFSCKANQRAIEDHDLGQGVFTHFLVEGLSGKADQPVLGRPGDGVITLAELTSYVSNNTYAYVFEKYHGVKQSPDIKGEFDTTLPLARITPSSPPRMPAQPSVTRADTLLTNSIIMKLVSIPAGEFLMGSPDSDTDAQDDEKPQHRVRITRDFYLGQTEVTQGQWQSVMGTEPWKGKSNVREGSDYPATNVSWEDASEFCRRLSAKEGKSYRLPSEAEWEYACRGGSQTRYSFGDDASRLEDYGWFDGNAYDVNEKYAHRVGQKKANAFGLYDMHGNVWEWCSDWYDAKYYGQSRVDDPAGLLRGSPRVHRGGSWGFTARDCLSANRDWDDPSFRGSGLGFRVALSPSGE